MPVLATSRNLTILGVAFLLGAAAAVLKALFDGDPATNVDFSAIAKDVIAGIGFILAKGASSTGGTVDAVGKPIG
jgi:uncharacterized membrane protein YhiD involved in acid resistance